MLISEHQEVETGDDGQKLNRRICILTVVVDDKPINLVTWFDIPNTTDRVCSFLRPNVVKSKRIYPDSF